MWLFLTFYDQQHFLTTIYRSKWISFVWFVERKKENASRHGKQPPPPPAVGGNVDIGKRSSLQANGKSMCKKIGWLLKSPSFAFGFACTTLNRCMLFKSLFVVVDLHLR